MMNRSTQHRIFFFPFVIVCVCVLSGCYSFTGSSIPPHLKTINVATVEDESSFGDALLRERLTQLITNKFRNDNSFRLVQENADATISTTIVTITEETVTLAPAGATIQAAEGELDRKMTITVRVQYDDRIKKVRIWEKNFSQFQNYPIAQGFTGRTAALDIALNRITEDILLAVVSGW